MTLLIGTSSNYDFGSIANLSSSESTYSAQDYTTATCKNSDASESAEEYDVHSINESDDSSGSTSSYQDFDNCDAQFVCESSLSDNDVDTDNITEGNPVNTISKCKSCDGCTPSFMKYCVDCWQERKKLRPTRPPQKKKKCDIILNVFSNGISKEKLEKELKCKTGNSNFAIDSLTFDLGEAIRHGMCHLCRNNPATHSLLHTKIAHQCVCYSCGKNLTKEVKKRRKCPQCKLSFQRMVRNIPIS